jgi:hypothetical protein
LATLDFNDSAIVGPVPDDNLELINSDEQGSLSHILVRHGVKGVSHLDVTVESDLGSMPGDYFKRRRRQRPEFFFFRQTKEG